MLSACSLGLVYPSRFVLSTARGSSKCTANCNLGDCVNIFPYIGTRTWKFNFALAFSTRHRSFSMPPPLLVSCLFVLLSTLSVLAESGAGSALYPPGLQPLINRANALLSAGAFHDAAKAYSEAIGTLDQIMRLSTSFPSSRHLQNNHQRIPPCITNAPLRISHLADTQTRSPTSTKFLPLLRSHSRKHT